MFIPLDSFEFKSEVDKSKFIAIATPFNDINLLKDKITSIKNKYPKAKHYLYAYKLNQISKCNDDNEPGSISKGMLELINYHHLDQILIIVVRYYGGVKLGAARLLRVYLDTVNNLLKNLPVGELVDVYKYTLEVDYPTFNKIKNAGFLITKTDYFDKINLVIISKEDITNSLGQFKINNLKVSKTKRVIK